MTNKLNKMEEIFHVDDNTIIFKFVFDGVFTKEICEKVMNHDKIIFNYQITNKLIGLPKHIKSVTLYYYNFPLDNLHNGLIELKLFNFYNFPLDNLPSGAEAPDVKLGATARNLPSTLKKIKIPYTYKYSLDFLPDGLDSLDLANYYNLSLENLPSSINEIIINYNWSDNLDMSKNIKSIDKILPNLKIIKLNSSFQKVFLEELRKLISLGKDVKLEYI